jgi:hypothetical protein
LVEGGIEKAHDNEAVDKNGSSTCSPCNYHRDTAPYQATFFALGAVGVAAGVVLVTVGSLPLKKWIIAPEVSLSEVRLSLTGKF